MKEIEKNIQRGGPSPCHFYHGVLCKMRGMDICMKKVFKLQDLGCANCAAKMEREINKIEGVNKATVNFITQKLTIDSDAEDFDNIIKAVQKAIKKIEPYCSLQY